MDFLNQGIPLGRWFGTHVVLSVGHIIMLLVLASGANRFGPPAVVAMGLVFFLSILLHEFGHVMACRAVGGRADEIILGPMGGLAAVQPPDRPWPNFVTTAGGPAVNVLLLAIAWGLPKIEVVRTFLFDPSPAMQGIRYFLVFLFVINKMLAILNLLPIFPMDGGRLMQHILWPLAGYRNSMVVTGMVGTVGGIGLLVLGLGLQSIRIPLVDFSMGGEADYFLLIIGLTCAMASWGLYQRSMAMERWRKN
jgi:Zn-dependent protease